MLRLWKLYLVLLVVIVLAFGSLWAVTRPIKHPKVADKPLLSERAIQKVLAGIAKLAFRGKSEVSLSEDEVNSLAQDYFEGAWWNKNKGEGGKRLAGYTLDRAQVTMGNGGMSLFFDLRYKGVPFYVRFDGVPELKDHHLGFDVSSMQVGAIPTPGFIGNRILARAIEDPDYQKSLTMRPEIRDVRLKSEDIVLTLER